MITADDRDALRQDLSDQQIETGIHYPVPVHRQPILESLGYGAGTFPQAEQLAARSLSLPMYPELPLEHLERVVSAIRRHYQA